MANTISKIFLTKIGGVLKEGDPLAGEKLLDETSRRLQKGPDNPTLPHRRNPGKPFETGTPEESHEERLSPVVGGVAEGQAMGPLALDLLTEDLIAPFSGRHLKGKPRGHKRPGLNLSLGVGHTQAGPETLHPLGFLVGLGPPKAVVDMKDPELKGKVEVKKTMQERDGVRPSRDPDEDPLPWANHLISLEGAAKTFQEGMHHLGPLKRAHPRGLR